MRSGTRHTARPPDGMNLKKMANKSHLKAPGRSSGKTPRLKVAPTDKPRANASGNGEALASRSAAVERKTRETEVKVALNLDGGGRGAVATDRKSVV